MSFQVMTELAFQLFLGCFKDNFSNRAMNVSIYISDDNLTPTLCKSKCKDEGKGI